MASSAQQRYATNLASEFYVLSVLYRIGLDANLTLSNKKGVDIVVAGDQGRAITIEVKGVAGKNNWIVGSLGIASRKHHYVVLVSYGAAFDDPSKRPKAWIFDQPAIVPFIKESKTKSARYISPKQIREDAEQHEDAWDILINAIKSGP